MPNYLPDPSSRQIEQEEELMKQVALSKVKANLSRFLRLAEAEEIVITRHGKPAAVLIGFKSEDDWFDYRLEHDPRFLKRVAQARGSLRGRVGIGLYKVREYFPNSAT
jgi:prevent-host-death family protein